MLQDSRLLLGAELGRGPFCPASLGESLPRLLPPQEGQHWSRPWTRALMTLGAAILVPAWLWGPGLPQPAQDMGHDKAGAQPPPPAGLFLRPRDWEE